MALAMTDLAILRSRAIAGVSAPSAGGLLPAMSRSVARASSRAFLVPNAQDRAKR